MAEQWVESFVIAQLGEPVLKSLACEVDDFASPTLTTFVDKLLGAMIEASGVGIAAPQVFCQKQIMIIASKPNSRYPDAPSMAPLVLINPQVEALYGDVVSDWEGCLSVPGIRGLVPRYEHADVSYFDCQGVSYRKTFSGFVARIFQHEYDHLIGKTFVDRVVDNQHLIAESLLPKVLADELDLTPLS